MRHEFTLTDQDDEIFKAETGGNPGNPHPVDEPPKKREGNGCFIALFVAMLIVFGLMAWGVFDDLQNKRTITPAKIHGMIGGGACLLGFGIIALLGILNPATKDKTEDRRYAVEDDGYHLVQGEIDMVYPWPHCKRWVETPSMFLFWTGSDFGLVLAHVIPKRAIPPAQHVRMRAMFAAIAGPASELAR
jgi:hypothetical protein